MIRASLCTVLMLLASFAAGAQGIGMKTVEAPAEPPSIPLGTGGVKDATAPESWFRFNTELSVRNVQAATLTPVLPEKGKATGAAVIVAPGGGFMMLSMSNEGWPVARWLADRGIAAFILKYRLRPTPAAIEDYQKELVKLFTGASTRKLETPSDAVADGEAAMRLVRTRAKEWGVDPARVGMLGFSAGAMTTLAVTLQATPATMPAFIAPIYGPMNEVTVPATAPPMFVVLAADDPLFAKKGFGLVDSWAAANKPVELHLFQSGGHGFGMGRAGTTTTDWLESFHRWLAVNGWLKTR